MDVAGQESLDVGLEASLLVVHKLFLFPEPPLPLSLLVLCRLGTIDNVNGPFHNCLVCDYFINRSLDNFIDLVLLGLHGRPFLEGCDILCSFGVKIVARRELCLERIDVATGNDNLALGLQPDQQFAEILLLNGIHFSS